MPGEVPVAILPLDAIQVEERFHTEQPMFLYGGPRPFVGHVIEAWIRLDESFDLQAQLPFSSTPSLANALDT